MKALFAAIDRSIELFVAGIFAGMVAIGVLAGLQPLRAELHAELERGDSDLRPHLARLSGHPDRLPARRSHHRRGHPAHHAPWMNKALDLLIELLWVGFAIATAYYSYRVSLVTGNSVSPGLEIPMSYPYYGMILGSVVSVLCRHPPPRRRAAGSRSRTNCRPR